MGSYKLSARARSQVHEIYDYSAETFGAYQANAYHAGLERIFGLLADFPRIGPLAEDSRRVTAASGFKRTMSSIPKKSTTS